MFLLHKKRSALDAHSALRENGCLCNRASAREFAKANFFYTKTVDILIECDNINI